MGLPGANQKNEMQNFFTSLKTFYSKKYLQTHKNLSEFPNISLEPLKKWLVISYVLNNNFLYTQLSLAFVPQKDSSNIQDDIDAFFLFLLQNDLYIAHKHIGAFCVFLLQKDFDIFHVLLFEAFLSVFDNS